MLICRKTGKNNYINGSITVEAAILLPVFIISVVAFVYIIKFFYTHEIVQQAITGACNEMGAYSLLYYETNAEELISGIEKFTNSEEVSETLGNSSVALYIRQLGKEASDTIRAQVALIPLTKYLVKKNLSFSLGDDVDSRLKGLHIKNGFMGIDFSDSRLLADGRSVDITAEYQMTFPFLSQLLPGLKISQSASCCIWAGEDGIDLTGDTDEASENIWHLGNLERGRKIRELQGANLPFSFPTVAIFKNGTVTAIKSLNMDETYYKNSENLKEKLVSMINKLQEFNGASSGDTAIQKSEILRKELRLIIPETELQADQQQILDQSVTLARTKGIELIVIKAYGKEDTQDDNDRKKTNQ